MGHHGHAEEDEDDGRGEDTMTLDASIIKRASNFSRGVFWTLITTTRDLVEIFYTSGKKTPIIKVPGP